MGTRFNQERAECFFHRKHLIWVLLRFFTIIAWCWEPKDKFNLFFPLDWWGLGRYRLVNWKCRFLRVITWRLILDAGLIGGNLEFGDWYQHINLFVFKRRLGFLGWSLNTIDLVSSWHSCPLRSPSSS